MPRAKKVDTAVPGAATGGGASSAAHRLQLIREAAGYGNPNQLAIEMAKLDADSKPSHQLIRKWEAGTTRPSGSTLPLLVNALSLRTPYAPGGLTWEFWVQEALLGDLVESAPLWAALERWSKQPSGRQETDDAIRLGVLRLVLKRSLGGSMSLEGLLHVIASAVGPSPQEVAAVMVQVGQQILDFWGTKVELSGVGGVLTEEEELELESVLGQARVANHSIDLASALDARRPIGS